MEERGRERREDVLAEDMMATAVKCMGILEGLQADGALDGIIELLHTLLHFAF